jgi:CheY-like chemotaxis protein
MSKDDKKTVFKAFIEKHDILVVDKNPTSRSRLIKIMSDLGSKRHMIHSVGTFKEAIDIINEKNIGVVLSDYFVGGGSGFDLFKLAREKNPAKKICLILVTSDLNQSTVAKAAEEDVDSYVIKPFTVESIQENLINTIADKVKPSKYIVTIEEGKELIAQGRYDEAIAKLQEALPMSTKPALAMFYIGQAEFLKQITDQAQGSYKKGLSYNNIHFKCLSGLFDLLMSRNQYAEAYEVVKKVAKYFPASPDRLQQVIRLAVQTNNFQDMHSYYELFTSLDERSNATINYIGAGLYVSGKYFMINNAKDEALKLFEAIGVSCSIFTKYPRAIITVLVENNLVNEAEKFLSRFDPSSRNEIDYLISDYLVDSIKFNDPNRLVKSGLELYNKNIKDQRCMEIMIKSMRECGYKEEKINDFVFEINKLWPEKTAA